MIECTFVNDNRSKSFVFGDGVRDIVRARRCAYKEVKDQVHEKSNMLDVKCFADSSDAFFRFVKCCFRIYSLSSFKGADAIKLNFDENLLACNMVTKNNIRIGLVIIGVWNHFYLLRFRIDKHMILESIYELDNEYAQICAETNQVDPSRQRLCVVCYKTSNRRHGGYYYCSKVCQRKNYKHTEKAFEMVSIE